jgi:hypothetical protein
MQILEQVEGGDLVVNRGDESRPKEGKHSRDLNAADSYETALKVAQVRKYLTLRVFPSSSSFR